MPIQTDNFSPPSFPTQQGKSSVSVLTLDVLPQDSETDMVELEKYVRSLEKDGLEWKQSSVVPFM